MKNRWNADAIGKWAANIIGKRGDAIDRAVVMVISPLQKRTGNVASKGTTPDLSMGAFSPAVGKFDFCINTWVPVARGRIRPTWAITARLRCSMMRHPPLDPLWKPEFGPTIPGNTVAFCALFRRRRRRRRVLRWIFDNFFPLARLRMWKRRVF